MPASDRHLTAEEVARILEIVQDTDAIVVGGQSVNLWARYYQPGNPKLSDHEPFTSKDIDFFRNFKAAEKLAEALDGGALFVPKFGDMTPSAAVVVGMLNEREIEIDFMDTVLGVENKSIANNYLTVRGKNPATGAPIRIMLLHPLDCLRSRPANIRVLGREEEEALNQTRVAIEVLGYFINDLLKIDRTKEAQSILHDLFYVVRDDFINSPTALRHGLNPLPVMKAFVERPELDERWRTYNLANAIQRLETMLERRTKAGSEAAAARPDRTTA